MLTAGHNTEPPRNDRTVHLSARQLFNDRLQLWIALPHDLVRMRGADLRDMADPVDGFMPTYVATSSTRPSGPRRSRNVCICFVLAELDSSSTQSRF